MIALNPDGLHRSCTYQTLHHDFQGTSRTNRFPDFGRTFHGDHDIFCPRRLLRLYPAVCGLLLATLGLCSDYHGDFVT